MSSSTTNTWPKREQSWGELWLEQHDLATPAGRAAFDQLKAGERFAVAFAEKARELSAS